MASLRTQVIETSAALMTAAFGVLAALAWNSAIVALVNEYLDTAKVGSALMIYAVIVTIIAVDRHHRDRTGPLRRPRPRT